MPILNFFSSATQTTFLVYFPYLSEYHEPRIDFSSLSNHLHVPFGSFYQSQILKLAFKTAQPQGDLRAWILESTQSDFPSM